MQQGWQNFWYIYVYNHIINVQCINVLQRCFTRSPGLQNHHYEHIKVIWKLQNHPYVLKVIRRLQNHPYELIKVIWRLQNHPYELKVIWRLQNHPYELIKVIWRLQNHPYELKVIWRLQNHPYELKVIRSTSQDISLFIAEYSWPCFVVVLY